MASATTTAATAAAAAAAADQPAGHPGLQPVLVLLRLDAGLLPPLLVALGELGGVSGSHAVRPDAAQEPAVSASGQAVPGSVSGGVMSSTIQGGGPAAAGSSPDAVLRAAETALGVLAAVLADPRLRATVLEAEAAVQRLLDAVQQATNGVGVGTVAGERCQRLLRDAQSSVDVLFGRLQHA